MDIEKNSTELLNGSNKMIPDESTEKVNAANETNSKTTKRKRCGLWLAISLLILVSILAAIVIAISNVLPVDQQDQCYVHDIQKPQNYKLYATKTSYSTLYAYLVSKFGPDFAGSRLATPAPEAAANSVPLSDSVRNVKLPDVYDSRETLETLHLRLIDRGCKVKQLFYFGRHGLRFPSEDDIEKTNTHIKDIQNRIDLSKLISLPKQQPPQPHQHNASTPADDVTVKSPTNSTAGCSEPLIMYKRWDNFMNPKQGNLVHEVGLAELDGIAKRFKSLYPELFDARQSSITIGVSKAIRTAQSALPFVRVLDNFDLGFCKPEDFPTNTSEPEAILKNVCYQEMISQKYKVESDFHIKCKEYNKTVFLDETFGFKKPSHLEPIASDVSKMLKLTGDVNSNQRPITTSEVKSLYKLCRYESALRGASIWCQLFKEDHLKYLEYLSDLDDYWNEAYGSPLPAHLSACLVTKEIRRLFESMEGPLAKNDGLKLKTSLYFSHSSALIKLIAATANLADPEFEEDRVLSYLQAKKQPDSRSWRTSLLAPFAGNLALTLYDCQKAPQPSFEMNVGSDAGSNPFKVIATLNERPIKLNGCSDHICRLPDLLYSSQIFLNQVCRLETICRKPRVYE